MCTYGYHLSSNYYRTKDYKINLELFHDHEFLFSYRWGVYTSSKRVIPKELIYLGNFQNIIPPKGEYLELSIINRVVYWKNLTSSLNFGMFDNETDKYRTYEIYDLERGLSQATIRNMLKEEGKDFKEYLKYLNENGIKY